MGGGPKTEIEKIGENCSWFREFNDPPLPVYNTETHVFSKMGVSLCLVQQSCVWGSDKCADVDKFSPNEKVLQTLLQEDSK